MLVFSGDGSIADEKDKMRGDGEIHYEQLELKRISCGNQFTLSNAASIYADLASICTDTRSSLPNEASHTPVSHICSYPPH
jgi:phosphoheptose isomerase